MGGTEGASAVQRLPSSLLGVAESPDPPSAAKGDRLPWACGRRVGGEILGAAGRHCVAGRGAPLVRLRAERQSRHDPQS